MKLYYYVHCPFCVRVRMGLGFLNLSYESKVLPYDDELTPVTLTGVKMLPIIEIDGIAQNESLNILKNLDHKNLLNWTFLESHSAKIENLISLIGSPVHSLCMPYWIWTPEFTESSRNYFKNKKEQKRGPFKNLIQQKMTFINSLNSILESELEKNLKPFYKNSELSIVDIMIASHLWGMYIFPEFQFSPVIHNYLQQVKMLTHFEYHQDFWN